MYHQFGAGPSYSSIFRGYSSIYVAYRQPPPIRSRRPAHVCVRVRDDETLDKALRRFTRECEKEGLFGEMRRHRQYISPSDERKYRKRRNERRRRKEARLAEQGQPSGWAV
ncbi:MAG: 30S ribosomal protein S21 [Patescibacteria group bacterium]|nr:30S ribosomal protein S21 [Patescibacteria group bacterium]MDD5716146.1 30S ribosomal protein S21 [Patescibacteria group bacterium]